MRNRADGYILAGIRQPGCRLQAKRGFLVANAIDTPGDARDRIGGNRHPAGLIELRLHGYEHQAEAEGESQEKEHVACRIPLPVKTSFVVMRTLASPLQG